MSVVVGENAYGPVDPVVAAGRRLAVSRMLDLCEVSRPDGVADPLTGLPPLLPIWGGPCEVSTYEPQESNPEAGGASLTVQRYRVKVPVGAFEPRIGDVVTITRGSQDPYLHGKEFRVVALLHKTAATSYRLGVEAVS